MSDEAKRDWRFIAADMIDARKFSVGSSTDPNGPEMRAASFIFDNGVFFLGDRGMAEVAEALRREAATHPITQEQAREAL